MHKGRFSIYSWIPIKIFSDLRTVIVWAFHLADIARIYFSYEMAPYDCSYGRYTEQCCSILNTVEKLSSIAKVNTLYLGPDEIWQFIRECFFYFNNSVTQRFDLIWPMQLSRAYKIVQVEIYKWTADVNNLAAPKFP